MGVTVGQASSSKLSSAVRAGCNSLVLAGCSRGDTSCSGLPARTGDDAWQLGDVSRSYCVIEWGRGAAHFSALTRTWNPRQASSAKFN